LLILAQSYPHVKNVLYLIDRYINHFEEIKLLIFQNKYLFNFFKEVNSEHFNSQIDIHFITNYSVVHNNKFAKYNLLAEKYFLYKTFKNKCGHIKDRDIYFFSKSFTDYGYSFLKKLHKNNTITHIQDPGCDIYDISDGKPDSIKSLIKLTYAKLLLGKNIVYGDTGREKFHNFFTISEKYYNKIVDKTILQDERDVLQRKFTLSKYALAQYSNYKVIYFDKDVVKDGLCDDEVFQKEINEIFNVITDFIPSDHIGRKYKPNRTTDYNKNILDIGEIIPDHIPAELLYNKNIDIYFGITSIALANIEKGNVISLAYLITFIDPKMREGSVQNQEKRKKGKKIYYPKTLYELRTLLEVII
jgi:hypothetical protein